MKPIQVVLVEDNLLFRDELCALLTMTPLIEVVGTYIEGQTAIAEILTLRPDVALIDLDLGVALSGIEVIRQVVARGSATECLVLTVYDDDVHLWPALQAGAVGYLVKDTASLPTIVRAIQEIIDGGAPMSVGIARRLLQEFRGVATASDAPLTQGLTKREEEILELLVTGLPTKQVAAAMHVSYETVRCHQKNIYRKLQVHSVVEALAIWRRHGRESLPARLR